MKPKRLWMFIAVIVLFGNLSHAEERGFHLSLDYLRFKFGLGVEPEKKILGINGEGDFIVASLSLWDLAYLQTAAVQLGYLQRYSDLTILATNARLLPIEVGIPIHLSEVVYVTPFCEIFFWTFDKPTTHNWPVYRGGFRLDLSRSGYYGGTGLSMSIDSNTGFALGFQLNVSFQKPFVDLRF